MQTWILMTSYPQSVESLTNRSSRDDARTYFRPHWYHYEHSLLEKRYGHLPRFLRFFAIQNWFKKLFPIFTLEVRGVSGKRAGGREQHGGRASAGGPNRHTLRWARWTAWPLCSWACGRRPPGRTAFTFCTRC